MIEERCDMRKKKKNLAVAALRGLSAVGTAMAGASVIADANVVYATEL